MFWTTLHVDEVAKEYSQHLRSGAESQWNRLNLSWRGLLLLFPYCFEILRDQVGKTSQIGIFPSTVLKTQIYIYVFMLDLLCDFSYGRNRRRFNPVGSSILTTRHDHDFAVLRQTDLLIIWVVFRQQTRSSSGCVFRQKIWSLCGCFLPTIMIVIWLFPPIDAIILWLCMPTYTILVAISADRRDHLVAVSANRHDPRGCFRRQTRHHVAVSANINDPRGCFQQHTRSSCGVSANRHDPRGCFLTTYLIIIWLLLANR